MLCKNSNSHYRRQSKSLTCLFLHDLQFLVKTYFYIVALDRKEPILYCYFYIPILYMSFLI